MLLPCVANIFVYKLVIQNTVHEYPDLQILLYQIHEFSSFT